MLLSLATAVLMLVGKLAAFYLTGSAAIFSDAAESVVHVVATALVAVSLWYALRPADVQHPYGHGKMAYLAAGLEGALIASAALFIIVTALQSLIQGPELRQLGLGLWITGGLAGVNGLVGASIVRTGRRHNNLVLVSNGQHILTDMWTSVGVVVGVALVWVTGAAWLDPVVALLVAANILWVAARLFRRSFDGLVEHAAPEDTRTLIQALDEAVADGHIVGYHQLRHRRVHDQRWVECHLLFPESLLLPVAHARAHAVEEALIACFPEEDVFVTTHLEPDSHDEAHPDGHQEPHDPVGEALLL